MLESVLVNYILQNYDIDLLCILKSFKYSFIVKGIKQVFLI
jgi:hypothetical protein